MEVLLVSLCLSVDCRLHLTVETKGGCHLKQKLTKKARHVPGRVLGWVVLCVLVGVVQGGIHDRPF